MKRTVKSLGMFFVRLFGSKIVDAYSGEPLGRALLFSWRGVVHLIGFEGERPVRPVFLPERKVTYWKQRIGFVGADEPDFPRHRE